MPKKTLLCEENYPRIKIILEKLCEGLKAQGVHNPIVYDGLVLDECLEAALSSLGSYQLGEVGDLEKISHYKEASHLAFWIAQLKPFRFRNPFEILEIAKGLGQNIDAYLKGISVHEEAIKRDSKLPLNEYLAFYLAVTLISQCQKGEIKGKPADLQPAFHERMALVQSRIKIHKADIIRSLRMADFTPRTFAMTIESLTRISEI